MGLMDKFKNLFTEEVEEEIEVEEEPIKKEVIKVEIPSPATSRRSAPEIMENEVNAPLTSEPKKEEYKFPFFDDEDFHTLEEKPKPKEEKKRSAYRKENKEVYSPPKEEKKVFKPTPIISPVYGILDKNYQKDDIKPKQVRSRTYFNPKEAMVDEIRNKAYGTLEDDIETTLFGRKPLEDEEIQKPVQVAEEAIQTDEALMETINTNQDMDLTEAKPRHGAGEESDLTDLLQAELSKEEPKAPADKPHKISDSELFSMIDSMYQKGDK